MADFTTNDGVVVSSGVTLISSWGGETSNSYIAVTEATSFINSSIVEHDAWDSATPAQKSAALLEATRDIDSKTYSGDRRYTNQFLELPRQLGSFPWDSTALPPSQTTISELRMKSCVERATCYQALYILQNSGRNTHMDRIASGIKSMSKTVGPISEQYTYSDQISLERHILCPQALELLSNWMTTRRIIRG